MMETNRNIDFNSEVEFDSLKDTVWRLTTRVYLLEDFISQKFGEKLGPDGYSKLSPSAPGPSVFKTSTEPSQTPVVEDSSISCPLRPNRKSRKRRRGSGPETEESKDVPKSEKQSDICNTDNVSEFQFRDPETIDEPSESDQALILKDEIPMNYDNDSDCNDDFLNDKSGEEDDVNDSVEKDPDFIPTADEDGHSQTAFTKSKTRSRKSRQSTENESREKPEVVGQKWTEIEMGPDELAAWQFKQKFKYRNFTTEYFQCMEGGRKCPTRLKCTTMGFGMGSKFYVNEVEHNHLRAKSGLTFIQKGIINELLNENSNVTPLIILEVLKDRGVPVPNTKQISNYIRYKRRKISLQSTSAGNLTTQSGSLLSDQMTKSHKNKV